MGQTKVVLAGIALAVATVGHPPAVAAVDLTGNFKVIAHESVFMVDATCSIDFVQTGMVLSATGSCDITGALTLSGTIDPGTGVFSVAGSAAVLCPMLALSATAADSSNFSGSFACSGGPFPLAGTVVGSRCGNGMIDPGETCDDGNNVSGDCCSATCQKDPPGAPCTNDFNQCTDDVCDAGGICQHVTLSGPCDDNNSCTINDTCTGGSCVGTVQPDGTPCDDTDPCTSNDACSGGYCEGGSPTVCPVCQSCDYYDGCQAVVEYGCKQSARNSIQLKDGSSDLAKWKWLVGDATAAADFGDPATVTSYEFCVYDSEYDPDTGAPRIIAGMRATIGSNWQPNTTGYKYKDASGLKIKLKAGAAGQSKILVKGKGTSLNLQSLPSIVSPLIVQLKASDPARPFQCWEGRYDPPTVSNPVQWKGENPQ